MNFNCHKPKPLILNYCENKSFRAALPYEKVNNEPLSQQMCRVGCFPSVGPWVLGDSDTI